MAFVFAFGDLSQSIRPAESLLHTLQTLVSKVAYYLRWRISGANSGSEQNHDRFQCDFGIITALRAQHWLCTCSCRVNGSGVKRLRFLQLYPVL